MLLYNKRPVTINCHFSANEPKKNITTYSPKSREPFGNGLGFQKNTLGDRKLNCRRAFSSEKGS